MLSAADDKPVPRTVRDVGALTVLVDNLIDDLEHGIADAGSQRDIGPAVFVITRGTPAEMADIAEDAADCGFASIKIKLGQGLDTDRAAMKAIRRAVGDAFPLCADANGAYGRNEVGALFDAAKSHDLFFIEDPCALPPLTAQLAGLRDVPIPIVLDRYCNSALAARQFIELGFNRFAAKPTRVGVSDAQAMINAAGADSGKVVIGLFGESAAGALTQLRVAAQAPEGVLLGVEASAHVALADNFLSFPISVRDGLYQAPPSLHLASAIDWQKLEALAQSSYSLRI
jgi:L-alanine-DL-glutamate epimerase-like enolase superfamily enzyme